MPETPNSARDAFYHYSEVLVEKGDHVRLQDVNISYNLDKARFKRLPFQQLNVYLYANNIGIIWRANKYGLDPDYPSGFPATRSYSLGIKAIF